MINLIQTQRERERNVQKTLREKKVEVCQENQDKGHAEKYANLESMQIHLCKLCGGKMYLNKSLTKSAVISLSELTVCLATGQMAMYEELEY